MSGNANDGLRDPKEKRRLQNRVAQRKHRMRRAAERDRNENLVVSKGECIHCNKTAALLPMSLNKTGTGSASFDFNATTDTRETGAASFLEDTPGITEYDFSFSRSMDEFLAPYDSSYGSKYIDESTDNSSSSPSEQQIIDPLLPTVHKCEKEKENEQRLCSPHFSPISSPTRTSLHLAADRGHIKIIIILLNSGASIESVDFAGRTPLHCAVESRQVDVVTLLLDRGADIKRKDGNGMSALHLAVDKGYEDIVLLLIEKGVDPNT